MKKKGLTKEVFRIALPIIISELGDSLYSITDTYFVSKIGETALAAVSVGSYLSWLFFVVIVLFSIGVLVYTAQCYGAKAVDDARKALGESIVFSSIVAFIVALVVYHISHIIVWIITGPNWVLVDIASRYLSVRILGLPFLATAVVMDSVIRGIGATKYSMIVVLSSAFLNIVLDPLFIFGLYGFPRMGVVGAALATVISIIYMIPLELLFLKKLSLLPVFSVKAGYIGRVVRIGLPAAFERLIFSLGSNAYLAFIARCGDTALAAHQVGVRIESFIYMPGFAFSVAASALVGQRIGAGDIEGGKSIGFEAAKLAVVFMGVLGVIVALTSSYLVSPFSPSSQVALLASIYLVLAGLSEPGLALAMALSGAIRGAGNTLVPMAINASCLYMFRVIPSAILTRMIGVIGAWIAMFVDVYLRGLIFLIVYKSRFTKLAKKVV